MILEILILCLILAVIFQTVSSNKKLNLISEIERKLLLQDQQLRSFNSQFSDIKEKQQETLSKQFQQTREELSLNLKHNSDSHTKQLTGISQLQDEKLEKVRAVVDKRLGLMQDDNNKKLDKMREVVDEKLHATLEKRLGESFKMVSERLEQVHKGLGEMQHLANGVGDLKKVLTNVKTRGTWGEIQLGNLLEQVLTKDQYEANVKIRPKAQDFVEFAIKLPGKDSSDNPVWLPIDAKYPQEAYHRLVEAQEKSDVNGVEAASKELELSMKKEARIINEKYIHPPLSTDFAILFLPIESLYAEALRIPGLHQQLQQKYRVLLAGPTTLAALLNSLQMGFRTLAVEKRSSEVWSLLSAVKLEFTKFGDILEKTQKKLQEAGNTIELATKKTRTIERKLNKVESLPEAALEDQIVEEPETLFIQQTENVT
ncbi:DNA recombination protein RmuC [Candidatus Marinamargulisbacteria bacterium SCGC AAA071-K20]|nr:DNA recombination protein RmuC [Candidatus Marinamargulisbacteria bacterium SCGC AAA071-K20]